MVEQNTDFYQLYKNLVFLTRFINNTYHFGIEHSEIFLKYHQGHISMLNTFSRRKTTHVGIAISPLC